MQVPRNRKRVPWILVLTLITGVAFAAAGYKPVSAAGSFTRHPYEDGFQFKVYVPEGYAGEPVPLMVMLHGCTQNADDFAAGTQMNRLADEENFIVLYPEMNPAANINRCWNWFSDAHQHRGSGEPAIIKGMVDWVKSHYRIDGNRAYVAGLSAGGAMSVILGAAYPDVFRGVGVHSGLAYDAANSLLEATLAMLYGGPDPATKGHLAYREMGDHKRLMPVLVFHGTADYTVAPVNGDQTLAQWAQTNDYADDGSDNGSVDDNADQTITGSANGRSYTRYVYHDGRGSPLMEKWIVNGLGHAWSGGSSSGSYADPRGPEASRILWNFFASREGS